MEWIFIVALGVWVFVQGRRISALEQRAVSRAAEPAAPPEAAPSAAPPPPAPVPIMPLQPAAPDVRPAPAAADSRASEPARVDPPAPPRAVRPAWSASAWIAENGLAWLGGGALTLGGLFLVVYVAQRGFFTPVMRVLAAAAAGLAMLGASEWIRRQKNAPGGRHRLAAALAAGAGAATIYGAVWAAHGLYHLLPIEAAAAMITTVSLALLGLAHLHGQPLAVLALAGAFAAPVVTGRDAWSPDALDGYLLALVATGYATTGLRRWGQAGLVTLAGAVVWAMEGLVRGHGLQAALLALGAAAGAALAAKWRGRRSSDPAPWTEGSLFRLQPAIALAAGGWILVLAPIEGLHDGLAWIVVVSALLAVIGAAAVSEDMAPPPIYPLLAGASAVSLAIAIDAIGLPLRGLADGALVFVLAIVIAGAGLAASLRARSGRAALAGGGALGGAVIASLGWPALNHAHLEPSWALPALTAALMAAGAVFLAGRVEDSAKDAGLGLWIAGTAELLFLTVFASTPHQFAPAVQAFAALALTLLAARMPWRGLVGASLAGGFVAFASLLRPAFLDDVLGGKLHPLALAAVAGVGAVQLHLGARVLRWREQGGRDAEGLDTWALLVALLGAFLLIHIWAAGGGQTRHLGELIEGGLRTDVILAAGLLLAFRATDGDGPVARWRLVATVGAGVLHGVLWQLLGANPWWGFGDPPVGPLVFNTLALTYLAPAVLLALTVRRGLGGNPIWSRLAAGFAFLFALVWALLEIRYDFHGRALATSPLERAEACA